MYAIKCAEKLETENEEYDASETPIKDKSMLGTHGKKLCANIDVYWLTRVTGDDDDDGGKTMGGVCAYS